MRTRVRAASPSSDPSSSHRSTNGGVPSGLSSSSMQHRAHHSHGPQPLAAAAPEREALLSEQEQTERSPPASLLSRLNRLRKKPVVSLFQDLKSVKVMGLDPSPELVAISMVYFVQGILGLSRLAVSFFFKDELHIEPAEVAMLTGLSSLPWMVKPLYGFLSDSVPLLGYRRRSYLVLCGAAGHCGLEHSGAGCERRAGRGGLHAAGQPGHGGGGRGGGQHRGGAGERAPAGEGGAVAGSLQSLCWASAAVGGITSAYFSGSFVQDYGCRFVFGLTAFFPLVVCASALLIEEKPFGAAPAGSEASALPGGPLAPSALAAAAAGGIHHPHPHAAADSTIRQRLYSQGVALWRAATPSADSAMFFYQTTALGFTPEFLGRVRLGGSLASLAGVAIFNGWLKDVPLRRMLVGVMVLGTALNSSQLVLISGLHRQWGLSDQLFVLGDSMVLTVLGQISWMPILVLAARMCPAGVEATLFATLMSVLNCGSITGSALGAGLTNLYGVTSDKYDNLFALVSTCIVLNLVPALFLGLLPRELDSEKKEEGEGAGGGAGAGSGRQAAAGAEVDVEMVVGPDGVAAEVEKVLAAGGKEEKGRL
ncbi:hypothetical protein CHLRE_01g007737v5 [Chlamydomonas reinhardtii]|uniref:Uncharacterized protein n=1 Tax=Chlamydomonas reinhardtii TaxID=3055 RepID=A0A2K3E5B8_CHLRE|nr:uncharacterized protein CHLRE_01g007737v5 [Chlamydomonas reinhardtii]PNW87937.1 hypothetical protein CHLRE_01g007737v5 [Chlamydomonas reinhardtii]